MVSAAATTSTADSAVAVASSHITTGRSGRGAQPDADLAEQAGLAHTARADQRDETVGLDRRRQFGDE